MNSVIDRMKEVVDKGGVIYANLSGGKDGQAMTRHMFSAGLKAESIIHCDLGRTEWPQSLEMCKRSADEFSIPLDIIYRSDKKDMIDLWNYRLDKLTGTGKPFWSSSTNRYCTSDAKRDPTDKFYRNCGHNLILSAEGIRSDESNERSKKNPFHIRSRITSSYYEGMTVEEAITNYNPQYRLGITCYPIFNFSLQQVFMTYDVTIAHLHLARWQYKQTGTIPTWWPFHPAYAMGNDRVSCMFCVLGSMNDLQNAAKHNPGLLSTMIKMEERGNATFKNNWSLKNLIK